MNENLPHLDGRTHERYVRSLKMKMEREKRQREGTAMSENNFGFLLGCCFTVVPMLAWVGFTILSKCLLTDHWGWAILDGFGMMFGTAFLIFVIRDVVSGEFAYSLYKNRKIHRIQWKIIFLVAMFSIPGLMLYCLLTSQYAYSGIVMLFIGGYIVRAVYVLSKSSI